MTNDFPIFDREGYWLLWLAVLLAFVTGGLGGFVVGVSMERRQWYDTMTKSGLVRVETDIFGRRYLSPAALEKK